MVCKLESKATMEPFCCLEFDMKFFQTRVQMVSICFHVPLVYIP